jgi:hypothetical protein
MESKQIILEQLREHKKARKLGRLATRSGVKLPRLSEILHSKREVTNYLDKLIRGGLFSPPK